MNELREKVEILLTEYAGQVHCEVADEYETAGDILALIAEAMLSEEVVEAAARATHSTEHLLTGAWSIHDLHESQLLNGPRTLDEEEREGYRYAARLSNKAALVAAGVTANRTGDHR